MVRFASHAVSRAGAAIDRAVLELMERAMERSAPRRTPDNVRELLDHLAAHYDGLDDFFPRPAPPERVERVQRRQRGDLVVDDLAFRSGYRASFAAYRDELAGYHANRWVRARHIHHAAEPRPTLIFLHGWGGGAYWFEQRAFQVDRFVAAGFDAVLFQLPFHYQRSPQRISGALFPSPHVVRTNEGFGQAVWDLRRLRLHLVERGVEWLGAIGMSLGGYTTALWAGLDELDAAVPMIPAVSMAELMWRDGSSSPLRRRAEAAGVDREVLRAAFAVHAPLAREVATPRERLMIVAGRGDRITGPDQARALWRHWREPKMHWFAGGHLAQVGRRGAFTAVREHLARCL